MFRKKPQEVDDIVTLILRANGLETPLLQRRLMNAWDSVAGEIAAKYTGDKQIRNQTMFVKIKHPAIRADLQMRRSLLVSQLNEKAGAHIIYDIKFY